MTPIDPALIAAHASPLHRASAQVLVLWDGFNPIDETAHVTAIRGVEGVDPASGQQNTTEVNIELDNSTRRYSPDNRSGPLFPHLTRVGQKAVVRLGWDGLLVTVATLWISDLVPDDIAGSASMRLLDISDRLARTTVSYGPAGNVLTSAVLSSILVSAGLVSGRDFILEPGETTCQFAVTVNKPALTEIQALGFAEGGRIFVDPDGVIRFLNRTTHRARLSAPLATFRRSAMAYEAPRSRRTEGLINRVVIEYQDRESAVTDEIVYSQVHPIAVPPATSWQEQRSGSSVTFFAPGVVTIQVRGMDRTRWERFLPLVFTTVASITANTAADGSGSNVPVHAVTSAPMISGFALSLSYIWSPDGSTGTLTFFNAWSGPVHVRVLNINGRPARTNSPWAVTVDDREAIDVAGGQIVEARIANAFLPSSDVATERARDYLWFRSAMRTRIDPLMDGVPFLHPFDAFAFIDDGVVPESTEFLQVLTNEWEFSPSAGYSCRLRTAPALPSGTVVLPDVAAPPPGTTIVTAQAAGPWTWNGTNPLVWDWSEWG